MGMWERNAQACAAVAVCALLRDPDSPAGAQAGAVCPAHPHPAHLSTSPGQDTGQWAAGTGTARCQPGAGLPGVTNPRCKGGGWSGALQASPCPGSSYLPGCRGRAGGRGHAWRCRGRRGCGSSRPPAPTRSGPAVLAPAGTGQLSPATVSCSQQPRGPGRDG